VKSPQLYGKSHAIWDHTVLPATRALDKTSSNFSAHGKIGNFIIITRQRWLSRLYSIQRPRRDARLS